MYWDAIPEVDMAAVRSIEPYADNKWNGNEAGAWRIDLGQVDCGL